MNTPLKHKNKNVVLIETKCMKTSTVKVVKPFTALTVPSLFSEVFTQNTESI